MKPPTDFTTVTEQLGKKTQKKCMFFSIKDFWLTGDLAGIVAKFQHAFRMAGQVFTRKPTSVMFL